MDANVSRKPPIKARDVIKYVFATVLAVSTFAAIAGMQYVKHQRRNRSAEERARIQETVEQYGTDGRLPEKVSPPPSS